MNPYTIWFVIFALIGYFIVTDSSVARLFVVLSQLARVQYEKTKWWVVHNPANPIVKYFMWRNSMKLAKELHDQLNGKEN